MENLIEKYYYDSTKGINGELLNNKNYWYNYVLNLPIAHQVAYTIVLFDSQIENGGFHQYFFNSYGQFAFLTLKNLKLIGANNRYILLDKAIGKINNEKLEEKDFRQLILNRSIKKIITFEEDLINYLDILDNEYYDMKNEQINELLEKYLGSRS